MLKIWLVEILSTIAGLKKSKMPKLLYLGSARYERMSSILDDLGLCDQRKSTSNSTGDHNGSATIVQLAPSQLQISEFFLGSLLSAILVGTIGNTRLEDLCQSSHSLVHGDLDQQRPSCSCNIQSKRSSEDWEFGLSNEVTVARAEVCGTGEDEVGERAQGVEGREEMLAVVEEVGGLLGCVVDWDVDDVIGQSGHDQR